MYRKINIEISPTLVVGRLDRKYLCACKKPFFKNDVPLGTRYNVDIKSVRWVKYQCFGCGKESLVAIIDCHEGFPIPVSWFPVECLDIFPAIPLPAIPKQWQKVKDNKVLPKQTLPGMGGIVV